MFQEMLKDVIAQKQAEQGQLPFEERDTTQIQFDSVIAFMGACGYNYKDGGWETEALALQHIRRLSHRTAIALHNLDGKDWLMLDKGLCAPLINGKILDIAMSGYTLARVQATKLVQKVKMQPNRKAEQGVELQSMMVKPMQPYMTHTLGLVM